MDVLISIGLTIAGSLIASAACKLPANPTQSEQLSYSACSSAITALPPFLIGSRTVEYRCR